MNSGRAAEKRVPARESPVDWIWGEAVFPHPCRLLAKTPCDQDEQETKKPEFNDTRISCRHGDLARNTG